MKMKMKMKMKVKVLTFAVFALGCAGIQVQGPAPELSRGAWGAWGTEERPVRYLDWSLGVGYSLKNWNDYPADSPDEYAGLPVYEMSFIYHAGYSWDIEFWTWAGRFARPRSRFRLQVVAYTLGLRLTRPAGLGWWHLSLGGGICDNDDTDADDAPAVRLAAGYTYPLSRPLNLSLQVGYLVNETHFVQEVGGAPISLSVPSASVSLTMSF